MHRGGIKGFIAILLALLCSFAIAEEPQRIVSLNPSATEILYALGKEGSLIAVSQFCPFSELRAEKENIGTILNPNVEKIVSLKPDLVFATLEGNRKSTIDSLREVGIRVFVLDRVRGFSDIYRRIDAIGKILHAEEESKQLILEMKRKIGYVRERVKGQRRMKVFLQLGSNPIISVNRDTIMNEVILLAGGENIACGAKMRYPHFSVEDVVFCNPDAIVIASMGGFGKEALRKWHTYKSMKAVQEDKIHIIDSELICNIGPRLVEGVEELARFLHPERFE